MLVLLAAGLPTTSWRIKTLQAHRFNCLRLSDSAIRQVSKTRVGNSRGGGGGGGSAPPLLPFRLVLQGNSQYQCSSFREGAG